MYVTSARDGMDKEWLSRQPQAGGIFKVNGSSPFHFTRPFFSSCAQTTNQLEWWEAGRGWSSRHQQYTLNYSSYSWFLLQMGKLKCIQRFENAFRFEMFNWLPPYQQVKWTKKCPAGPAICGMLQLILQSFCAITSFYCFPSQKGVLCYKKKHGMFSVLNNGR